MATTVYTADIDHFRGYMTYETSSTNTSYTVTVSAYGVAIYSGASSGSYDSNYKYGALVWSGAASGSKAYTGTNGTVSYSNPRISLGSQTITVTKGTSAKTLTVTVYAATSDTGSNNQGKTVTFTIPALTKYTVSYNANNGSGAPSSQTKYYGKTLTLSSTKPTKKGYTFSKWNTNSGGTGTNYSSGGSYTANASATLYAQWTANKYTLTYNANGGACSTTSKSVTYDSAYGTLATPTRAGYTFDGWYTVKTQTGGEEVDSNTVCKGNATIYARWTPNTYTVKFNSNYPSGTQTTKTQTHTYDTALALTSNTWTYSGYAFQGWATSATGAVKYTDKQSVKNLSTGATVNLYAVWSSTYTPPTISNVSAVRCNSEGEETLAGEYVKLSFNWTAGLNPNGSTYNTDITVSGAFTYSERSAVSSGSVELSPLRLAIGQTSTATITVVDYVEEQETTKTVSLPKGGFPIHISKNEKAIRFFGVCDDANDDGVYIDGDLSIQGHDSPIGTIINVQTSATTVVASGTRVDLMSIDLPEGVWVVRILLRFPAMGSDRTKTVEAILTSTASSTAYMYKAPCENMITNVMLTQIVNSSGAKYYVKVYHNSGSDKTFPKGSSVAQHIRAVRIA